MSASNGIAIADARKKDMPLIFVNPAFERITGYSWREVIGTNCRFLQGKLRAQPGLVTVRRALTSGNNCRVVLKNFRKDGSRFWNELYLTPIRASSGKITHYVAIQTDVTRRIEAERAEVRLRRSLRKKNRELKALNEQKNGLLGMAAHDIQNPLAVIMLCSDMLISQSDEKLRVQLAKRMKQNAQFMRELVNDLLDVSKIEAGKLTLKCKSCNLRDLIHERMPMYRQGACFKEITVQSRCASDLPAVYADVSRITQVIDNLISNAVKFSYAGQKVILKARQEGSAVQVSVMDHGQGIPEAERQKLFLPFSKTSVKGTAGEKSTGLGLAICRKIIEAHPDGRIAVESEVGKGSTFSFWLPVYQAGVHSPSF